jgi:hypothetical protein
MPQAALSIVKSEPLPTDVAADPHQAKMSADQTAPHANPDTVTVQDIEDDPRAAFAKMGALLKRDLSNPRTWVMAAAAYFGPKVVDSIIPIAREAAAGPATAAPAAPSAPSMLSRMGTALKTAGPDLIGMISPRAGKALDVARSAAEGYRATAPEGAPAEMPAAAPAPASPSTAAPAPTRPAAQPVPAPVVAKLKLTTEEFRAVNELVKQGYPLKAVLEQLQQQRLPAAWRNLPTDADVAAAVKSRNDSGKWLEDQ